VTRIAARVYEFDFRYQSGPSWDTYASLLEFSETVRSDQRDLRPATWSISRDSSGCSVRTSTR